MEERAEYYVRQGNDAMAKEALKRKADSDANVGVLQGQLQAQSDMVGRLKGQLDALQAKYQDAMANRDNADRPGATRPGPSSRWRPPCRTWT